MDEAECEGEADAMRAAAGVERDRIIEPMQLVLRLPTVALVRFVYRYRAPFAWRAENDQGLDEIELHNGHSPEARNLRVVCEGVEGRLARRGLVTLEDPHIKRRVVSIATRVILPRYALRSAFSSLGMDIRRLAAIFGVSQITLVVRLAEVRACPTAIVTAKFTWCVGPAWGLPSKAVLAKIARRGSDRHWHVVQLTDTDGPCWAVWLRDH